LNGNSSTKENSAGTILAREYQGRDIVVKVLDNDFEFEGRRYKLLSAIARKVTGTKWNGFLFFCIEKNRRTVTLILKL
jgi:hypothetical protein